MGHGAELLLNSETEKERNRLFYQRRAPLNSHGRPRLFGCCLGLQGILRAEKPCVLQAYAQSDGGNRRSLKTENSPKAVLFFLWLSKVQIERRGTQGFRGIAVKPCKIGRR